MAFDVRTDRSLAGDGLSDTEMHYINLLNGYRAANGLATLSPDRELVAMANRKAIDIQENIGFQTHDWSFAPFHAGMEIMGIFDNGNRYSENIFIHPDSPTFSDWITPEKAHAGFVNSPPHDANQKNPVFDAIGVGIVEDGYVVIFQDAFSIEAPSRDNTIPEKGLLNITAGEEDSSELPKSVAIPTFNEAFYLFSNADVAAAGINPKLHYLQYGEQEGRKPNQLFDPIQYLAANPDVAFAVTAGNIESALHHFVDHGLKEGRPGAMFDEQQYLAANPDVQVAVLGGAIASGFEHALAFGLAEGRAVFF